MTPSIVTGIVNILFCPCLPKIASWFYKIKSPLFFKINVQWLLYSCVYPKWISYLFFFFQFRDSKWIVIFHFKKTNAKLNVDEHCLFANNCPSNRERYFLFIQWKTRGFRHYRKFILLRYVKQMHSYDIKSMSINVIKVLNNLICYNNFVLSKLEICEDD